MEHQICSLRSAMDEIDVRRARSLTPGCEQVLHLDHAGASLAPQPVLDAIIDHLQLEARIGAYRAAATAVPALDRTYDAVATLIGCDRTEVALTDSATRGWTTAVYSLPLREGDRLVTTRSEYGSNAIALLQLRRRTQCDLVLIDDDGQGHLDLDGLTRALDHPERTVVSLTHVPSHSGVVNPAALVGKLCREANAVFVLDACQSAGQLPLDVTALGCHILTATGRKFLRGPRGTGFLYVSEHLDLLEPLMLDMASATWIAPDRYEVRTDARRFEQWEANIAARVGLGVAIDLALDLGLDAIATRNAMLAEGLRARLERIAGVTLRDRGDDLSAITTFTLDDMPAAQVAETLRDEDINVAVSPASSSQLDLPHRGLDAVVRASVHYLTTDDELDRFAERIEALSV